MLSSGVAALRQRPDPHPEFEALYLAEKYIRGARGWEYLQEDLAHYEATVWTGDGKKLQLRASMSRGEIAIVLACRNTQVVRKYHSHTGHRNPGGEIIDGPHKHYPSVGDMGAHFAYEVYDISADSDLNEALIGFLDESRIDLVEPYQRRF